MNKASPFGAITKALAADGFVADLNINGTVFRGSVIVNSYKLAVSLRYSDYTLCESPRTFIENPEILPRKVLPHLDEENELCVVDRERFVPDRYSAPAEARGLLVKARKVIERGLTKNAVEEIAQEFPQHWSSKAINVEFGRYKGPLELSTDAGSFLIWRPAKEKGKLPGGFCVITNQKLSFLEDQNRPSSLREVLNWADKWDKTLRGKILSALDSCNPLSDPTCFISAPNGTVGFQLLLAPKVANAVIPPEIKGIDK